MITKKNYHRLAKIKNPTLDDIGFIGTQEKISETKRKQMIKKTGEIIRAWKAEKTKRKTVSK